MVQDLGGRGDNGGQSGGEPGEQPGSQPPELGQGHQQPWASPSTQPQQPQRPWQPQQPNQPWQAQPNQLGQAQQPNQLGQHPQPNQPWYGQPHQQWAGPQPKRTLWPWLVVAGVFVLFGLGVYAVVSDPDFQASFREGLAEGLGTRVGSLEVGACFDGGMADDEGNFDERVTLLECDEAHDSQLIDKFDWLGSEANNTYPGEDRMVDFAERRCLDAFYRTVGVDYRVSVFEMSYAHPSSQTWRFGDRSFLCIVHGPNTAKLSGPVDNSRR